MFLHTLLLFCSTHVSLLAFPLSRSPKWSQIHSRVGWRRRRPFLLCYFTGEFTGILEEPAFSPPLLDGGKILRRILVNLSLSNFFARKDSHLAIMWTKYKQSVFLFESGKLERTYKREPCLNYVLRNHGEHCKSHCHILACHQILCVVTSTWTSLLIE